MTTAPIETTTTSAKKTATRKPVAKKATAKKPTAKKPTAKKPAAKKPASVKVDATAKPAAKQARKVAGIRPVVTPAAVGALMAPAAGAATAAAAAAPSFLASLVEDFAAFDLRNLPSLEVPGFLQAAGIDAQKAMADVAALPGRGRELVSELAAEATKRGTEAVSAVDHVVTLVREAVGV